MLWFSLAAAPVLAAAVLSSPCQFVLASDVLHVLHWKASAGRESEYHLPQASGAICKYEAHEGTVMVTIPAHGSSFFNNNDLVDPFKNGMGTRVTGIAASVALFDNTAYVNKHGRSISVAVLPVDGAADERALTLFAKIVTRRMP